MEQDKIQGFLDKGGVVTIENWYWHDPYLASFGKDEKGYWTKGWNSLEDEGGQEDAYERMEGSDKIYYTTFEECRGWMFGTVPIGRGTDENTRKIIEAAIVGNEGTLEDI